MKKIVTSKDWINYADAVGDFNEIHRDERAAKKYGLSGIIAPGMWLASHIQEREKISEIKQIKFLGNVLDGDYFEMKKDNKKPGERNYEFYCNNKKICDIKGVRTENYKNPSPELKKVLYHHKIIISEKNIKKYWNSVNPHDERSKLPLNMYLASLFAPTLLEFGKETKLRGFHTNQNFQIHKDYSEGEIDFLVGDKKDRGPLSFLQLRGYQNGDMIISGRAGVIPF